MCSSPPLRTSRSMVVEAASILSPVSTERTMASDSPARSLDEIDLSALRVNVSLCVHVHVVSLSVCARASAREAPASPPPSPSSPASIAQRRVSLVLFWFCVRARACAGWNARARRAVIDEISVCPLLLFVVAVFF